MKLSIWTKTSEKFIKPRPLENTKPVNRKNEKINKWKDISTKVEGLVHVMFSKCKRFSFVCHCSSLYEETFLLN